MAVAFVKALSEGGFDKTTSANTWTVTTTGTVAAGNTIVAHIIFDNAATTLKPIVSDISKAVGETGNWVFLGAARSASTTAGAATSGEIWAIKTSVAWPAGGWVVSLDAVVTSKAANFYEFSGVQAALRSTSGGAVSTTTTAASATSTGTAPVIGDLALGLIFQSNSVTIPATDTDVLGGAWVSGAAVGSTGGSAATNNFGRPLYKILTAASAQTVNCSAALTAGNGAIVVILQAYIAPTITQASYRFYADGTEAASVALAAQDTAYTADVTSADVSLLVRARLQITNATGMVDTTDDWQLQFEKNASGSWANLGTDDGYSELNQDSFSSLDATTIRYGQSFVGNGKKLLTAGFWLRDVGAPAGNMTASLYAHTGPLGNGTGTGAALATSSPIAANSLTTSFAWVDFTFPGTFTMVSGTNYVVVVEYSAGVAGNLIQIGLDASSPSHAGNSVSFASAAWTTGASIDVCFRITTSLEAIPFNSANLADASATTNRLGAGTGIFVAGRVSEDGLVDNHSWSAPNYTELLYTVTLKSTRLVNGDTIRFRILQNGVTTNLTYTLTPTIPIIGVAPPTTSGRPKIYSGAAFVQKPLKVWTGAAWVEKPVKVWTGSAWKTLT